MMNLLFNKYRVNIPLGRLIFLMALLCSYIGYGQNNALFTIHGFYGSRLVEVPYDGGYLIVTTQNSNNEINTIKKLNRKGDVLWTVKPELEDSLIMTGLGFLSNNDIIVSAGTAEYWSPYIPKYAQAYDGVLLKINTCGEVEWLNLETRHENLKMLDVLRLLTINENDEIWVNQYCSYPNQAWKDSLADGKDGTHFIMNKYDTNGDLLETTDDIFYRNGEIKDLVPTSDGGVLIVGHCSFMPHYNEVYDPVTNPTAFARGLVMKYDSEGEIEWYKPYRWEEDHSYLSIGSQKAVNDSIVASRASGVLSTDSNTFIIAAFRMFYDTLNTNYYNKLLIYEMDIQGNMLWDTLYDYHKNVGFTPLDILNDTTLIITSNSFQEWTGGTDYELEVWKIDSRTWDITGRYIDSNQYFHQPSSSAISEEGNILTMTYRTDGVGTQIRVIDPVSMTLDTIPAVDTNTYDYLCSGVFSPDEIDLPDDTAYYEPIGLIELNNNTIEVFVKDKVLFFNGNTIQSQSFEMLNSLGQMVLKGNTSQQNYDLFHLVDGTYFIDFKNGIKPIKFVLK